MFIVTCSGSFRSNGEIIDFSDFKIKMPSCPDNWIQSNAADRCFARFAEKKFKKRVDSVRTLYVDDVDKDSDKNLPSCCGKKIKGLDWDELQEFAMMFCLRGVPLYKTEDLRAARAKAYKEYVEKIQDIKLSRDFNYAAAPDFPVPDVVVKRATYQGNASKVISGGKLTEEI